MKALAADARLLWRSVYLHVVLVEINLLELGRVSRTLWTRDLGVIEVCNPLPRKKQKSTLNSGGHTGGAKGGANFWNK